MAPTKVSANEFVTLEGLEDWRFVLNAIHADFRAGSFSAAASLVSAVAAAADEADHHPDIDVRYPDHVRIMLTTHSAGGLTNLDVDLARAVSAIAHGLGASSDPANPQAVEIAIDTLDADRIRPFWAAILGYRHQKDGSLMDPMGLGPPVWFQSMDEPRPGRDRFHIDVSVPHDVGEARVAAALDAGGTLVTDRFARSWWVLADADGNEACVCTYLDR